MKNYFKILLVALIAMVMNVNLFGQGCTANCLADGGPNKQLCQSVGFVTIGATNGDCSFSCNDAGITYSWAPATALSSTSICNPTASPTVTTTYTLYVTFPCGACCCEGCGGACASTCTGSVTRSDAVTVYSGNIECFNTIEPIDNSDIKLLTDPSNGKVKIQFVKVNSGTTIQFYNETGQLVLQMAGLNTNQNVFEYYVGDLKAETFFVRIKEGENITYFQKLI
ncbi:MAG TPA: hypothetical protein VI727_06865 [Candidatus Brocadiaceae bacterium]|nr:hypothetical protein [Candidatus Brocadiaceae bacterium]